MITILQNNYHHAKRVDTAFGAALFPLVLAELTTLQKQALKPELMGRAGKGPGPHGTPAHLMVTAVTQEAITYFLKQIQLIKLRKISPCYRKTRREKQNSANKTEDGAREQLLKQDAREALELVSAPKLQTRLQRRNSRK